MLLNFLSILILISVDLSFPSTPQSCVLNIGNGKVESLKNGCRYLSKRSEATSKFTVLNKVSWKPKNENLYADFKINNLQTLDGLEFRFSSNDKEVVRYSLPLFKIQSFNIVQNGNTSRISFPLSSSKIFGNLESLKIDSVTLYASVKKNHSIDMTVSNFQTSPKKWKNGAVSFSFDDGYKSQLKAFSVMKKHNIPGTAFIIPEAVGTTNYMTWGEVRKLSQWGWDISTHHQTPITKIPSNKLKSTFLETQKMIYTKGFPRRNTRSFAYPLGLTSQKSLAQLKGTYDFGRLASGGSETLPLPDPLKIKTFNVLNTTRPDEILNLVKKAQLSSDWVVLMFHYFDQPQKGELNYSTSHLKSLVEKLKSINANIVPMSVVLDNKSSSLN